jgi:DNA-binding transcriptional MerR regulator
VLGVPDPRRLVTTGELAKRLGISRETVRRYYNSGDLVPAELSPAGHPRWIEEDVREQMRSLRERLRRDADGE